MTARFFTVHTGPRGGWVVWADETVIPLIYDTYRDAADAARYLHYKHRGSETGATSVQSRARLAVSV